GMSLVPEGEVFLASMGLALDARYADAFGDESEHGRTIQVAPVFLDRRPVTNREFYEFVAAGGYEQVSLWDRGVWTAVLDMADRTGKPGPRYWRDGVYLEGQEDHPVVGVSWYEAMAYARWIGKRLPSDAEWVKAGAWPLPAGGSTLGQRRYPWGDSMDRSKANLWGSGPARIVSVHEFAEGVSVGGVHQLIGNVWEWTSSAYRGLDGPDGRLEPEEPMKSLRGGAFDTYFDLHATCQFQSGDAPLRARYNIGFRCAVGVCDLVFTRGVFTRGCEAEAAMADGRGASGRDAPALEESDEHASEALA
ncbi:MAG: SUMF1/EgtB/PvdO family nonheme iron enzyme, partial [Patescibacteria group bacterium]|nr:SUMF1/EgtB/PvdO family nonheme iron enzyme [Patescibacteria group bacterium]